MKQKKRVEWTKLDNASKIFPATANFQDTKVFRLSCELYEDVDPEILQKALDATLEKFPLYRSVLRRGVFWYYFENSDMKPQVKMESNPVCAPIYFKELRNLLFRVFYFNKRISIEVFHALSDGTGALWFLQTLVASYLLMKYEEKFNGKAPELAYNASISEKTEDSFEKYYTGGHAFKLLNKSGEGKRSKKSYHVKGARVDENRLKVIEGSMSAEDVLKEAHRYNTTLTVFLTALFIYSIYKQIPAHSRDCAVVMSVPINLRQYFKSVTARNFFSTMRISCHFDENNVNFEDIIQSVNESFHKELTRDRMEDYLNRYISLEKNPFTRNVPLPLKELSLRIANYFNNKDLTASISNLGRIYMPDDFSSYIRQFSVFTSAVRPQITMCTYKDRLVVGFNSPYLETDIQRTFFSFLAERGIEIEISSNL